MWVCVWYVGLCVALGCVVLVNVVSGEWGEWGEWGRHKQCQQRQQRASSRASRGPAGQAEGQQSAVGNVLKLLSNIARGAGS